MKSSPYLHMALLLAGVGLVYCNSLQGSFHYDDFHSIVENPHIRDSANSWAFFSDPSLFSVDPDKAMYRPLPLLSYTFNYAFGAYQVLGYHLFNIGIHLLCSLLVWRLGLKLGFGDSGGLLAALLFALHPLATEPVNYISSRSESMGALAYLGGFWSYLSWRSAAAAAPRRGWYLASLAAFVAGLLSKSIAITLPAVLLAYEFCMGAGSTRWARLKPLLPYHLGYWLLGAAYLLLIQQLLRAALDSPVRTLDVQIWTQLKALVFYAKLSAMPVGLNVEHQFAAATTPAHTAVLLSALVLISAIWAAWRGVSRGASFWLLWVGLSLAPTLLVPLNVLVNEHRLYLPVAALALLGGRAWAGLGSRCALRYALAAGLILFGVLSFQRNAFWENELSLWQDAVAKSPRMPRAQVHLGNALRQLGQLPGARAAYEAALDLDADHRAARTNLGNLYYEAAATDSSGARQFYLRAAQHYQQVLDVDPTYREALNNLGGVLEVLGRAEEAMAVYGRALAAHPNFAPAYFNLGQLKIRENDFAAGIGFLKRGVELEPTASSYFELGNAYVRQQDLEQAARAYRQACRLDGREVSYFYNLGEVLLGLGQRQLEAGDESGALQTWGGARRRFLQVVDLDPDYRGAQLRLRQLRERLP